MTSPVQQAANDALLPMLDPRQPTPVSRFIQVGHILQTDKDGSFFRLFATGLRNPMDVAFNADGEMFTYEADMERDIGAPWYRPTRILQIVPGGDYGWRRGMGNIPLWAPDPFPPPSMSAWGRRPERRSAPAADSPNRTGSALFVGDWAYGRILAVFLKPKGRDVRGEVREFLSGRPLNITDLTFGADGAMYFVTEAAGPGRIVPRVVGRRSCPWNPEPRMPEPWRRGRLAGSWSPGPRVPRRSSAWCGRVGESGSVDPQCGGALERIPSKDWSARALAEMNETRSVTALLRAGSGVGQPSSRGSFARLLRHPLATLVATTN